MSRYRIITDGKLYKVQRRHMFAWLDEGRHGFSPSIYTDDSGYSFTPYLFHTVGEAERHIQEEVDKAARKRPVRWRVVKVIKRSS